MVTHNYGKCHVSIPLSLRKRLNDLRVKLDQVNRTWTIHDYETLLDLNVEIVPKILRAERCSIFIVDPETENIWLRYGTGLKEKEILPSEVTAPPKEGTAVGEAISSGKWIIAEDLTKSNYHKKISQKSRFKTQNLICAPIKSLTGKGVTGAIEVLNKRGGVRFSQQEGELLQQIAGYLSMAIENIQLNREILKITNSLNREISSIWKENIEFIAESPAMKNILRTVQSVSATPVNVLIHGESGTGKEIIARMIHRCSDRSDKPFVSVNCASIPETLTESEFFGYEKGAFTGAVSSKKGYFEEADGGILFMDEIKDMPLSIQPKFLRVIQESEGYRLGSNKPVRYDLRLISATNRDLRKEVADGIFREDLFYRIFSVDIYIPPLRERREDIIPLTMLFLGKVCKRFGKQAGGFSPELLRLFEDYPWPGNVRQLLHEIERLIALTPEGEAITCAHCSRELQEWRASRFLADLKNRPVSSLDAKVKELEIGCIGEALQNTAWNKVQASRILGITRQGLDKKIKRYKIHRSPHT